jgi:hypothetical protein
MSLGVQAAIYVCGTLLLFAVYMEAGGDQRSKLTRCVLGIIGFLGAAISLHKLIVLILREAE